LATLKIFVFKPYNIRVNNAFFTGQHTVFSYLSEKYDYRFTYLVDLTGQEFEGVDIKYLRKNQILSAVTGARRLVGRKLGINFYCRYPFYESVSFGECDLIVTEGVHYSLLKYVEDHPTKTILNDSITLERPLPTSCVEYLNSTFSSSMAIVVNEKIRQIYRNNGLRLQTCVIGHAVETKKLQFKPRDKIAGRFVSVGRLVPEKGYEYIIEAFSHIVKKYPRAKLDVYGEGPTRDRLTTMIVDKGLSHCIFLKGFIPHERMLTELQHYDVLVTHPVTTSYIAEAFLMSNLEAMALGLPVVTSDCGGVPFVVGQSAVVVPEKSVSALVEAVEKLLEDPQTTKYYSHEGRKLVEREYDLPIIAHKWNRAIQEFLRVEP
jgi:glycosyltransferase involved in cell wall biosynthesis